ncbi:hypothetical protein [Mesorhizobium sp. WSM3862]|uniref:hypothetical protein n=1 Tax=Mesorhizobium sp. WSM3862 TaxID=632858 RepID=UPI001140A75E|nr:hypothetical protein [Mesorhizobium sp. WSM3862]
MRTALRQSQQGSASGSTAGYLPSAVAFEANIEGTVHIETRCVAEPEDNLRQKDKNAAFLRRTGGVPA